MSARRPWQPDSAFWRWVDTEHWTVDLFRAVMIVPVLVLCIVMLTYYSALCLLEDCGLIPRNFTGHQS